MKEKPTKLSLPEAKKKEAKKNIRVPINNSMVIMTDDPDKVKDILERYKDYADPNFVKPLREKKYINEEDFNELFNNPEPEED